MHGDGEEASALGGLGAVGVWDAFGDEPDVARSDALLVVLRDEAEFAFEDVEDLVFGVVDVQWGGIAEGDAVFEKGDAVLAVGFGDANGDGGVEEPEGSGVDEREGSSGGGLALLGWYDYVFIELERVEAEFGFSDGPIGSFEFADFDNRIE